MDTTSTKRESASATAATAPAPSRREAKAVAPKIDPKSPDKLPRLFALDSRLAIAGGYVYALNCNLVADSYCASSIGCASGCGGGGDGGDGDGGGCGGD